jgi:hypothetical protein
MFDEQNLYANIPAEQMQGGGEGQYQHEAQVPALPPAGGGIQTGQGSWAVPMQNQPQVPPGAAIIPTGDMPNRGMYQQQQMEGWLEPEDTSPEAAGMSAGITALFVAGSIGLGYALGGWKGAVAGGVLSGAVANGYRAQKNMGSTIPDQKHEAVVSSVFAVAGLGLGGYVVYKIIEESGSDDGGGDYDYGDDE